MSCASTGSSTSAKIMARSSTISQPIATWPLRVSINCRSSSERSSTTVLATESASPNTNPAASDQPSRYANPIPSSVATAICATAPGTAMLRTANRSL